MSNAKNDDSIFGMIKLGLILAVYAVISCTVLAVVNNFTAPKIAQNQVEKVNSAMKSFFPEEGFTFVAMNDYEPKSSGSIKIENIILAKNAGPTYDQATILVGMGSDGIVKGVQFLKNTDSPGFGLKANDSTFKLPNGKTFYGQFEGKDAKAGFELGKNFDAISGATITSNGVAGLLNAGTEVLLKYAGGHNE